MKLSHYISAAVLSLAVLAPSFAQAEQTIKEVPADIKKAKKQKLPPIVRDYVRAMKAASKTKKPSKASEYRAHADRLFKVMTPDEQAIAKRALEVQTVKPVQA